MMCKRKRISPWHEGNYTKTWLRQIQKPQVGELKQGKQFWKQSQQGLISTSIWSLHAKWAVKQHGGRQHNVVRHLSWKPRMAIPCFQEASCLLLFVISWPGHQKPSESYGFTMRSHAPQIHRRPEDDGFWCQNNRFMIEIWALLD